jgi:hexosaminidase
VKKLFLLKLFLILFVTVWSQAKPALIPLPQQLKWNNGFFDLKNCKLILVKGNQLSGEAGLLQSMLKSAVAVVTVRKSAASNENYIELRMEKFESPSFEEAYKLLVTAKRVIITANTSHGIFNGIQTFFQLLKGGTKAAACKITDWPAFSWRGYMIDVGRNFMSMKLLKQQIDVMTRYKLNVFHFHATEDIAWRIAIKQYPQLTAAENMIRNKGKFYSEADIKELIEYCKQRHITFVPEIDMPGHSAAFKRAMKVDMQSDSGMMYLKNILKEFFETYDVSYLHIGADEVKITNKNFIPEITAYVQSFGKKIIGWQPGGNFTDNTIRQLWMDDNAHLSGKTNIQYIDSRHLYLNHMDPLESVVTIFSRKICDKEKGDTSAIGATLCMWHDRAVANENDILKMNPVYPGLLVFGERTWRGGGQTGWIANISDGNEKAFAEFEDRLLQNKNIYFKDKSFPYIRQSNLSWKLYGAYDNGGDLNKVFEPETKSWDEGKVKFVKQAIGGTIILRHWWAPLIKGMIDEPKENTIWYATTKIWSDEEGIKKFWIGFNNLSRSPATDSPPLNAWDNKGSVVWVNGKLIEPPQWKHGGQKGNSEIPLIDEGYEYRESIKIFLQKGWNTVLIKLPIGSFIGKDWQNPVKWMFTFVCIDE